MESSPLAVKAWNLNHWTAWEVLSNDFLNTSPSHGQSEKELMSWASLKFKTSALWKALSRGWDRQKGGKGDERKAAEAWVVALRRCVQYYQSQAKGKWWALRMPRQLFLWNTCGKNTGNLSQQAKFCNVTGNHRAPLCLAYLRFLALVEHRGNGHPQQCF